MKNEITQIYQDISAINSMVNLVVYRANNYRVYSNYKKSHALYQRRSARLLQFALAYAARLPGAVEER